jgi:hypothetical protein
MMRKTSGIVLQVSRLQNIAYLRVKNKVPETFLLNVYRASS